jgi:sugar lactone lactonase YvrE
MRHRLRWLLFAILFYCFASPAQEITFKNLTTKDGLLSNEVYNMHQDKKGYIWLFTNNGVQKYNGREFQQVLSNLPYRESFIYCAYERKDGRLWVANANGKIYEVIRDSAFQVPGTEKAAGKMQQLVSEIYQLYVDDSLNIYSVSKRVTNKYIKQGDHYDCVELNKILKDGSRVLNVLERDSVLLPVSLMKERQEYTGTPDIQFKITPKGNVFSLPNHFEQVKYAFYYNGRIYLTFLDHVGFIKNDKLTLCELGAIALNISPGPNKDVWVAGYTGGLLHLDSNLIIVSRLLTNRIVNDVLIDRSGGIWASTTGSGVFYCSHLENKAFPRTSALAAAITFVKKIDTNVFAGSFSGSVYRVNGGAPELVQADAHTSEPLDIERYQNNYTVLYRHGILPNGKLKDGNVVINGIGLLRRHNDTIVSVARRGVLIYSNQEESEHRIFTAGKINTGVVWQQRILLASDNGIFELNGDTIIEPADFRFLRGLAVLNLKTDLQGNLWICSADSGLYRISRDKNTGHFYKSNGLPANTISNISFDGDKIMLCTFSGAYTSRTMNNWKRIYEGAISQGEVYSGSAYLGTPEGLVIVALSDANQQQIPVYLRTVELNGQPQPTHFENTKIQPGDNLDFVFDAVEFGSSPTIRYRLNGPVADSGTSTTGRIRFQYLTAGDYTLTATAGTNPLSAESVVFTVHPHLWDRPGFYVLLSLFVLIAGAFGGWKLYLVRKARDEKKSRLEKQILEYKLIAVKAQINPHFVSNCLTAIQQLVVENKVRQATQYIAEFGLLLRKILNYSERSFISLKEELEVAELAIHLESLRFEDKFDYKIHLQNVNAQAVEVPALILNPIIENAIWHGLLPLAGKRKANLYIACEIKNDVLSIKLTDNGNGRKPQQTKSGEKRPSGLKMTGMRLENINRYYGLNTAGMRISDIKDGEHNSAGTCVELFIPLNLDTYEYETDQDSHS